MNDADARRRRTQLVALALLAGALVVALLVVVLAGGGDDESGGGGSSGTAVETLYAGIPQSGTVLGEPDAPLLMVEFADLQCPFCAEYATGALHSLIEEYVRPGDLRLDLQLLTFLGPDSEEAARLAAGFAEQDLMWQFVDIFYANQGVENSGYVDEAFLREIADQVPGADVEAALAAAESPPAEELISGANSAARSAGVSSTPSFLLGPDSDRLEPLEVANLDAATFAEAIDAALENPGR